LTEPRSERDWEVVEGPSELSLEVLSTPKTECLVLRRTPVLVQD
jgi:hypothetical protein